MNIIIKTIWLMHIAALIILMLPGFGAKMMSSNWTSANWSSSDEPTQSNNNLINCNKTTFNMLIGHVAPYAFSDGSNSLYGPVHKILVEALEACCGSNITILKKVKGKDKKIVEEFFDTEDIALPIIKPALLLNAAIMQGYRFIPVMETSGSVTIILSNPPNENIIGQSLLACWPLSIIVITSAGLAGLCMWLLDRNTKDSDFPQSYTGGVWEGTWWAFVTMTTVGYGDRAPKSFPARLFGLLWMYAGIILMSIFTATLTTAFSADQSKQVNIKGEKIAVLSKTLEVMYAYREGADVLVYDNIGDMTTAVMNETASAALVDINLALYHVEYFQDKNLAVHKTYPNPGAIGTILQNQSPDLELCMSKEISKNQYAAIDNMITYLGKFKGRQFSLASEVAGNVLSSTLKVCLVLSVIFIVATAVSVIWQYFFYRQNKKIEDSTVDCKSGKMHDDLWQCKQDPSKQLKSKVYHGHQTNSTD